MVKHSNFNRLSYSLRIDSMFAVKFILRMNQTENEREI